MNGFSAQINVHFGSRFLFICSEIQPDHYHCKYAVCSVYASPRHCAIFSKFPGIGFISIGFSIQHGIISFFVSVE